MTSELYFQMDCTWVLCVCVRTCMYERERTNMASSRQLSSIYLVAFQCLLFIFENFLYAGETETKQSYVTLQKTNKQKTHLFMLKRHCKTKLIRM